MRHSFLPSVEQKTLKRSYRVHAAAVALFVLSVAGIIGIGGLFPAYIQVSTEERAQAAAFASAKKKANDHGTASLMDDLKTDSVLIQMLGVLGDGPRSSDLIQEVVSARGSVKITSVAVTEVSTSSASMVVQGVAPTRESLVSLKARLENLSLGNRVELPISELAKSRDISFSLRFTRTQP